MNNTAVNILYVSFGGQKQSFLLGRYREVGLYVVLSLTFRIVLVCLLTLVQGTPLASCGPALGVLPCLGTCLELTFLFFSFFGFL